MLPLAESALPIIPTLQGDTVASYHRCADLYERHGVDLTELPLVGVGSVCRRQHTTEVERIMRSLAARGLRLHGFGVKISGLGRYAEAMSSADSASVESPGPLRARLLTQPLRRVQLHPFCSRLA